MADPLKSAKSRFEKALNHLNEELKGIRTGRAAPMLVENIAVEVYGQPMALKQVASVNAPDAKSLTITPWDPNNLAAIESAISADRNLGLNPNNDGKSLHLNVPPLTEDRREVLVRQVGEKAEEAQISLRNIRRDILSEAKSAQDSKEISEDEYRTLDKNLSVELENWKKRIEDTAEAKRQEISSV